MKTLLILSFTLWLAGCSGTGGTIGGLIPAPKILKGEVTSEGMYISENQEFSVILPHPPNQSLEDRNEWIYTKIHEINEDNNMIVGAVFGPAAFDRNLYHSVIIKKPPAQPLEPYVEKVFDKKAEGRGTTLSRISSQQFKHNGKEAFYNVYESDASYLLLSLVAAEELFYVVEIDISKNTGKNLPTREELINKQCSVFNQMFLSFKIL